MDIAQIAHTVTATLVPYMPSLLAGSKKAVEESVPKAAGAVWEGAKALWEKIHPRFEAKPAALEAARDVANAPDDTDAQAALRLQLKKLLEEDETFANEIWQMLSSQPRAAVIASGERAVAIGGNATGSTIIAGNNNQTGNNNQYAPQPGRPQE